MCTVVGLFLICDTGSGWLAVNKYKNDSATWVRKKIFYRGLDERQQRWWHTEN